MNNNNNVLSPAGTIGTAISPSMEGQSPWNHANANINTTAGLPVLSQ